MRPPTTASEPVTRDLPRVSRPARRVVAVATALAVSAGLAACSTQSGYQTQVPYVQADGVPANIGSIQARNLVVVAQSKGAAGVVSGSLNNLSPDPVTVTVAAVDAQGAAATGTPIQVKAGQQQQIQGVEIASVPVPPGDLTEIVLKTPAGQQNVKVPVVLPEGYYATFTATPGATPSGGTATAPASGTPSPVVTSTATG